MSTKAQPRLEDSPTLIQLPGRILSLPEEILTEIFRQFHLLIKRAPFVLTHVCSRWREAAIKDPALWIRVDITSSRIEQAKTILSWSGSFVPLRVRIRCDRGLSLAWLEPYVPRIKQLTFIGDHKLEFPNSNLNQLRRLDLKPRRYARNTFLTQSRELQSLRHLTLNETVLLRKTWKLLPLSQLTDLVINSNTLVEPRYVFRLLLGLKDVRYMEFRVPLQRLECKPPHPEESPYLEKITLRHLRELTLQVGWMTSILLQPLILPRLEDLSISWCKDWVDPVTSLAKRSSFKLTRFSIHQCSSPGDITEIDWVNQISQLLTCVPSIEYFYAAQSGALGAQLFKALTSESEDVPRFLGPSLRTLSMANVGHFECTKISQSELVAAFKSRNHGVKPGIWADSGRSLVVVHHDRRKVKKEWKRMVEFFSKEVPDFRYAVHVAFRS